MPLDVLLSYRDIRVLIEQYASIGLGLYVVSIWQTPYWRYLPDFSPYEETRPTESLFQVSFCLTWQCSICQQLVCISDSQCRHCD